MSRRTRVKFPNFRANLSIVPMKKIKAFYEKYKEYIMVDTLMYIVMFVGIFLFFALGLIFGWI